MASSCLGSDEMKKVVRKLFLLGDIEREEAWLNELAEQGWVMTAVKGGLLLWMYEFERRENQHEIRLQVMEKEMQSDKTQQYISLVEETGARLVCMRGKIAYFCRAKSDVPFELFSDCESRLAHCRNVLRTLHLAWMVFILHFAMMTFFAATGEMLWAIRCIVFEMVFVPPILRGYCRIRKKVKRLQQERVLFE